MTIPNIKNYCVEISHKFKANDPVAKVQIRGLSNHHRKVLIDIVNGKLVNEAKANELYKEIQKINKPNYVYQNKGSFKEAWNAVKHFFGFRIYSSEVLDKLDRKFSNTDAFFAVNATYQTDGKGIDDVAYANHELGFGYVADGTGHNNPKMSKVLNSIFSEFNKRYEEEINQNISNETSFDPIDDYIKIVKKELTDLGDKIHNEPRAVHEKTKPLTHLDDGQNKPAFSFAQIIKIDEDRKLITAQFSDTIILIKKADGSFYTDLAYTKDTDKTLKFSHSTFGLGDPSRKPTHKHVVHVTDIGKDDVVYGFSDGIGEFLSLEELQNLITKNKHPAVLLDEIKDYIIEKGKNPIIDEHGRRQLTAKSANGMGFIKYHDPNDAKYHDDIGMFMLKVK